MTTQAHQRTGSSQKDLEQGDIDVWSTLDGIMNDSSGPNRATRVTLGVLRIALGWTFLWALLDKAFGLGFDTCRTDEGAIDTMCNAAFLKGGSPTWGFLTFGTAGSKTGDWFSWLASSGPTSIGVADLLYLGALLVAGVTFVTGIALRVGAITGTLLMMSIYLASSIWPQYNPFMDEHIIYSIAMIALALVGAGRYLGAGAKWADSSIAQRFPLVR